MSCQAKTAVPTQIDNLQMKEKFLHLRNEILFSWTGFPKWPLKISTPKSSRFSLVEEAACEVEAPETDCSTEPLRERVLEGSSFLETLLEVVEEATDEKEAN